MEVVFVKDPNMQFSFMVSVNMNNAVMCYQDLYAAKKKHALQPTTSRLSSSNCRRMSQHLAVPLHHSQQLSFTNPANSWSFSSLGTHSSAFARGARNTSKKGYGAWSCLTCPKLQIWCDTVTATLNLRSNRCSGECGSRWSSSFPQVLFFFSFSDRGNILKLWGGGRVELYVLQSQKG